MHQEARSQITPFDFKGHEVRVLADDPSNPLWVAADVAKVLGHREAKDMTRNLRDRHKGRRTVPTPGGSQEMTVITEAGLYAAVLKSRVPAAEEFQDWVTDDVLPSIRKHGAYMTGQTIEQVLTDPDTIIKLATDLKRERERISELEPAAASWNHLAAPGGDYGVAAAAKVLSRDPEITIGRDRLFKHMAAIGWIFRTKGKRAHWEAYQQKALDTGRLAHKLSAPFFNEKTEEWEQPAPTIRITPKGLHELHQSLGGTDQIQIAV